MKRIAAVVILVACSSSEKPPAQGPVDHELHWAETEANGVARTEVHGHGVDLAKQPIADWIGLPATGTADINLDVRVPIRDGARDYREATGRIEAHCTKCRLGDDDAKRKASADVYFAHIDFDHIDIEITIANGKATVTQWSVASPDVKLELTLDADLGRVLEESQVNGCVRFAATPAFEQRDPKTNAALVTTGAPRGPNNLFNMKLAGELRAMRLLPVVCGG